MLCIKNTNSKRLINLLLLFRAFKLKGVYLARGTKLYSDVCIDDGTRINGPAVIKGHGFAEIGKYCAIGDSIRIITSNHGLQSLCVQYTLQTKVAGSSPFISEKKHVKIMHDVWIGDNVIILPGVHIGNGAVIGAGSVVTRSVNAYDIVAGNPAKKIGCRFHEGVSEIIEALEWWDWEENTMRRKSKLFQMDFSKLTAHEVRELISFNGIRRE
jgi:acetyltransferase-like isoleucine patch superfamily enzyme